MGRWEFIWIALRVIGGYWGIVGVLFGVHWEFIFGSMDVIGESLVNTYGSFEVR